MAIVPGDTMAQAHIFIRSLMKRAASHTRLAFGFNRAFHVADALLGRNALRHGRGRAARLAL